MIISLIFSSVKFLSLRNNQCVMFLVLEVLFEFEVNFSFKQLNIIGIMNILKIFMLNCLLSSNSPLWVILQHPVQQVQCVGVLIFYKGVYMDPGLRRKCLYKLQRIRILYYVHLILGRFPEMPHYLLYLLNVIFPREKHPPSEQLCKSASQRPYVNSLFILI